MLAVALAVFSFTVYAGVRAYLTNSMKRTLVHTAESIVTDYLVPLNAKGNSWFLDEMSESYPPGISDPFVRVSQDGKVLYESGDIREPLVRVSKLPLPADPEQIKVFRRLNAETGQPLMVYTLAYTPSPGTADPGGNRRQHGTAEPPAPQPVSDSCDRDADDPGRRRNGRTLVNGGPAAPSSSAHRAGRANWPKGAWRKAARSSVPATNWNACRWH